MQRMDDSELSRPPSEVLDVICKLGKGSYGSVFKARYKATGDIVAVKKVPVDSDLADIVKEISIMQQCDSPFIVKCYGSLFDSQDLWICMEYCGAGSVADIMRLRGKPLAEFEIATVLRYSLLGLDYLHQMRKIHRDIKAGNILLLNDGMAKLADFGVAGQLSDTLAKRNTVIGTPYWMAPEVIQEIGYNCSADIWSLGITAIEMADGKPPLADIHPMRALFMIPSQPAPALRKPSNWSPLFRAFVTSCLVKTPEGRPSAAALLQTEFIRNAQDCSILLPLITEASDAREKRLMQMQQTANSDSPSSVIKRQEVIDSGAVNPKQLLNQAQNEQNDEWQTMTSKEDSEHIKEMGLDVDGTLVSFNSDGSTSSSIVRHGTSIGQSHRPNPSRSSENLDTMVVNATENEYENGSVIVHRTGDSTSLDNHERDQREAFELLDAALPAGVTADCTLTRKTDMSSGATHAAENHNEQVMGSQYSNIEGMCHIQPAPFAQRQCAPFPHAMQQIGRFSNRQENEPGALNCMSYEELEQELVKLTAKLETELRNLAIRYRHKRQPLLDAIAEKTAQVGRGTLPSELLANNSKPTELITTTTRG